ncbi:hypothetical protein [Weissella cibaria]|uniref:hypothetical protein n=1 Tax=Weissella cibaria TaxID=137591 RepID=UPI00106E284C|nr:hypothetical protein [Weissella cibaria]
MDNKEKYTLKDVLNRLVRDYGYQNGIQSLRKYVKDNTTLQQQKPGKALPIYTDADVQMLANQMGLSQDDAIAQEAVYRAQLIKETNADSYEEALRIQKQNSIGRYYDRTMQNKFREIKTLLLTEAIWFEGVGTHHKFDDAQLKKDLEEMDIAEAYNDADNPDAQFALIKLSDKIADYTNYI